MLKSENGVKNVLRQHGQSNLIAVVLSYVFLENDKEEINVNKTEMFLHQTIKKTTGQSYTLPKVVKVEGQILTKFIYKDIIDKMKS